MDQNEQYQNQVTIDDITGTLAENSREMVLKEQLESKDREQIDNLNPNKLTAEEIAARANAYDRASMLAAQQQQQAYNEQINRSVDQAFMEKAKVQIQDKEKELAIEANRQEQLLRLNQQKEIDNAYLDNNYSHTNTDIMRAYSANNIRDNMSATSLNWERQLEDEANLQKIQANQRLNQRLDEIELNTAYQRAMNNVNLNSVREKMNLELEKAKRQVRISNKALGNNADLARMLNNVAGEDIQFYTWADALISGTARAGDSFLNVVGGNNMLQDMLGWEYASRTGGVGNWYDRFNLDDLGAMALNSLPEMVAIGLSMAVGGGIGLAARGALAGVANAAAGTNVAKALKFADSLTNAATKLSMSSTSAALEGSTALRIAANTIRRGVTDPKFYTSLPTIGGGILVDGGRRAIDLAVQRSEKTGEPVDITLDDYVNGLARSALDIAGGAATAGVGYGLSKAAKAILPGSKTLSRAATLGTVGTGFTVEGVTETLQTYLENYGMSKGSYPNLFDILTSNNPAYAEMQKELVDSFTYGTAMGAGFTTAGGIVGAAQKAMSRPTGIATATSDFSKVEKLEKALNLYKEKLDEISKLEADENADPAALQEARDIVAMMKEDLQQRVGDSIDLDKLNTESEWKKTQDFIRDKKVEGAEEVIAKTEIDSTDNRPDSVKEPDTTKTLDEIGENLAKKEDEQLVAEALGEKTTTAPVKGTLKKTKKEVTAEHMGKALQGTKNAFKVTANMVGDVTTRAVASVFGDSVDKQGIDTKENKQTKKGVIAALKEANKKSHKGDEKAQQALDRIFDLASNPKAITGLLRELRNNPEVRDNFIDALSKGDVDAMNNLIKDRLTETAKNLNAKQFVNLVDVYERVSKGVNTAEDITTAISSFKDDDGFVSTVKQMFLKNRDEGKTKQVMDILAKKLMARLMPKKDDNTITLVDPDVRYKFFKLIDSLDLTAEEKTAFKQFYTTLDTGSINLDDLISGKIELVPRPFEALSMILQYVKEDITRLIENPAEVPDIVLSYSKALTNLMQNIQLPKLDEQQTIAFNNMKKVLADYESELNGTTTEDINKVIHENIHILPSEYQTAFKGMDTLYTIREAIAAQRESILDLKREWENLKPNDSKSMGSLFNRLTNLFKRYFNINLNIDPSKVKLMLDSMASFYDTLLVDLNKLEKVLSSNLDLDYVSRLPSDSRAYLGNVSVAYNRVSNHSNEDIQNVLVEALDHLPFKDITSFLQILKFLDLSERSENSIRNFATNKNRLDGRDPYGNTIKGNASILSLEEVTREGLLASVSQDKRELLSMASNVLLDFLGRQDKALPTEGGIISTNDLQPIIVGKLQSITKEFIETTQDFQAKYTQDELEGAVALAHLLLSKAKISGNQVITLATVNQQDKSSVMQGMSEVLSTLNDSDKSKEVRYEKDGTDTVYDSKLKKNKSVKVSTNQVAPKKLSNYLRSKLFNEEVAKGLDNASLFHVTPLVEKLNRGEKLNEIDIWNYVSNTTYKRPMRQTFLGISSSLKELSGLYLAALKKAQLDGELAAIGREIELHTKPMEDATNTAYTQKLIVNHNIVDHVLNSLNLRDADGNPIYDESNYRSEDDRNRAVREMKDTYIINGREASPELTARTYTINGIERTSPFYWIPIYIKSEGSKYNRVYVELTPEQTKNLNLDGLDFDDNRSELDTLDDATSYLSKLTDALISAGLAITFSNRNDENFESIYIHQRRLSNGRMEDRIATGLPFSKDKVFRSFFMRSEVPELRLNLFKSEGSFRNLSKDNKLNAMMAIYSALGYSVDKPILKEQFPTEYQDSVTFDAGYAVIYNDSVVPVEFIINNINNADMPEVKQWVNNKLKEVMVKDFTEPNYLNAYQLHKALTTDGIFDVNSTILELDGASTGVYQTAMHSNILTQQQSEMLINPVTGIYSNYYKVVGAKTAEELKSYVESDPYLKMYSNFKNGIAIASANSDNLLLQSFNHFLQNKVDPSTGRKMGKSMMNPIVYGGSETNILGADLGSDAAKPFREFLKKEAFRAMKAARDGVVTDESYSPLTKKIINSNKYKITKGMSNFDFSVAINRAINEYLKDFNYRMQVFDLNTFASRKAMADEEKRSYQEAFKDLAESNIRSLYALNERAVRKELGYLDKNKNFVLKTKNKKEIDKYYRQKGILEEVEANGTRNSILTNALGDFYALAQNNHAYNEVYRGVIDNMMENAYRLAYEGLAKKGGVVTGSTLLTNMVNILNKILEDGLEFPTENGQSIKIALNGDKTAVTEDQLKALVSPLAKALNIENEAPKIVSELFDKDGAMWHKSFSKGLKAFINKVAPIINHPIEANGVQKILLALSDIYSQHPVTVQMFDALYAHSGSVTSSARLWNNQAMRAINKSGTFAPLILVAKTYEELSGRLIDLAKSEYDIDYTLAYPLKTSNALDILINSTFNMNPMTFNNIHLANYDGTIYKLSSEEVQAKINALEEAYLTLKGEPLPYAFNIYRYYTKEREAHMFPLNNRGLVIHKALGKSGKEILEAIQKDRVDNMLPPYHVIKLTKKNGRIIAEGKAPSKEGVPFLVDASELTYTESANALQTLDVGQFRQASRLDDNISVYYDRAANYVRIRTNRLVNNPGGGEDIVRESIIYMKDRTTGEWRSIKGNYARRQEDGTWAQFNEFQMPKGTNYLADEILSNLDTKSRILSPDDTAIIDMLYSSMDKATITSNINETPITNLKEIKQKKMPDGTQTMANAQNSNNQKAIKSQIQVVDENYRLTEDDFKREVTEADYTDVVLKDILDTSTKVSNETFFNDIHRYLNEMGNKVQADTIRSLIALAPKNLDVRYSNMPEGVNGLFTMVENVPTIVISNNASGRTKLHEFLHAMSQHVLTTGHPSINAAKGTIARIKAYVKHLIDTKQGYGESIGIVKNGRIYREIFNEGNVGEFISYFLSDPEKLNALHYLTKDDVKAWEKANNMKEESWLGRGKRLVLAFIKSVVTLFNSSLMSNTVNRDLGTVLIDSTWDIGKYSNQEYVDSMISTKLRRALDAMNLTFKHLIYRGSLGLLESEAHFIKRHNIDEDEYIAMRNDAYKQVLRNYKKYGAFTPAAVALTLDLKTLFNPVYRSAMAEVWRNTLNSSDKALYKEINNILLNFRVFHDKSDIGTSYRAGEGVSNASAMVQGKIEAAKASGYKFIDEAIQRTFPNLGDEIDNPNTELYRAIKAIQEKRGTLYHQANYQTNLEAFKEAMGLLASLNLGDAVFHEMSKDFMKNKVEMDLIFDFIYNRDSKYGELMPRLYAKRDFLVKNIIQQLKKLGVEREGLDNFLINGSNLLAKARITDNYSGAGLRNVEVLLEHLGDAKLTERIRQAYTKTDRRINYISETLKALVATNTMIMVREPSNDPDIIFMSQSIALAGTVLATSETNTSVKFLYPIINEWKNLQDELVKRIKANISVNGDGIQLISKESYNDLGGLYMDNWTPSVWRDNVQVVHLTDTELGNWGDTKEEARKNLKLAGFKQIDPKNGKEIEMEAPVEHYVYTGWARYEDTYEPNMQLGSTRRTRGYVVDINKDKIDANYANAILSRRDEVISSLFEDTDSFKSSYLDKPKTSDFEAFDSLNSNKLRMNMTRLEKMNTIKLNYSIDEMMAQAHGQLMAKGLSDEMDTHLADALFQDTLKVYEGGITDMNNYVAIFTNKWMNKEGQVPEQFQNLLGPTLRGKLADIMHKYNKGSIEVINGVTHQLRKPIDTIYVRKELVDIYFGGLDTALANKATNGITKKILGFLDAGLKGGMREYKNNVILRSPEVIISNVISNLATTTVAGVSPVDAMQSFEPLANEILEFRNLKDEFFKAYQKYSANPTRENQSAMYRIDKKMKELSVYKPLTMGLDSNIIDDISTDKNDNWIDSGAAKAATYLADTFGWSRDTATKWAAEAVLSPNSEIIKFSTLVTQLSDLIPKILIYQRAKAEGKSDTQAINEANDYLVNYNMPMKGVVYKAAEKYAMAPFFKWFAGQQKISSKMLVEKPITAASVLAFNTMMSPFINISSVATENALIKGTPFGNFMPDNLFRYNFIL